MANQKVSAKISDQAHQTESRESSALHGASERSFEQPGNREAAAEMMEKASNMAADFYQRASTVFSGESRGLYMAGAFVAIGLIGFVIGRSLGRSGISDIQSY